MSMEVCTAAGRFDMSRFGYEVFWPSPRQADLLIVSGTLTWKMARPSSACMNRCRSPNTSSPWAIALTQVGLSSIRILSYRAWITSCR